LCLCFARGRNWPESGGYVSSSDRRRGIDPCPCRNQPGRRHQIAFPRSLPGLGAAFTHGCSRCNSFGQGQPPALANPFRPSREEAAFSVALYITANPAVMSRSFSGSASADALPALSGALRLGRAFAAGRGCRRASPQIFGGTTRGPEKHRQVWGGCFPECRHPHSTPSLADRPGWGLAHSVSLCHKADPAWVHAAAVTTSSDQARG
jgi:hypothetical protein